MLGKIELQHGDCGEIFSGLSGLQALVMDPPAGIRFMNVKFDHDHGGRDLWVAKFAALFKIGRQACERGAYSLTWALPKTSHWTACALDDAGWEICDVITHHFGNGWPKNAKTALKPSSEHWILSRNGGGGSLNIDECRVPRGAEDWPEDGRSGGISAKPDVAKISGAPPGNGIRCHSAGSWPTNTLFSHHELCEERGTRTLDFASCGTVRRNPTMGYGGDNKPTTAPLYGTNGKEEMQAFACLAACPECGASTTHQNGGSAPKCDCGERMTWCCPIAQLDEQSGSSKSRAANQISYGGPSQIVTRSGMPGVISPENTFDDQGGASRFFNSFYYAAKASSKERRAGCEHMLWARDKKAELGWRRISKNEHDALQERDRATGNVHPTVKNMKLSRHLVKLITPKGGTMGDMFCGSGSIPIAAALEGRNAIGSDMSADAIAIAIAYARAQHWLKEAAK